MVGLTQVAEPVTAPGGALMRDERLPEAAVLLGEDLADIAALVLGQTPTSVTRRQVRYRPRREVAVHLDAGLANGSVRSLLLVASVRGLPVGATAVEAAGLRVGVVDQHDDPALPGLAAALDPVRIAAMLRSADVEVDPADLELRIRAHRAGRRAVVEVIGPQLRWFFKVVRPHRADELHRVHRRLAHHLPVPISMGIDRELGIVALTAVGGSTLRELLLVPDAVDLLAPEAVVDVVDRLTSAHQGIDRSGLPPTPDPAPLVATHARLLRTIAPHETDRISRMAEVLAGLGTVVDAVVHHDLHDAQLMVSAGHLSGILDLDTVAPGERARDLGWFAGHLTTLGLAVPAAASRIDPYVEACVATFDGVVDPARLRLHAACAAFGLASGPFRVQESDWVEGVSRRLDLVDRWIDRSRTT
ncbi:MAG: phosphotransferase [Acidimicrobiales bacterium]